jgi:hypothetical protein
MTVFLVLFVALRLQTQASRARSFVFATWDWIVREYTSSSFLLLAAAWIQLLRFDCGLVKDFTIFTIH